MKKLLFILILGCIAFVWYEKGQAIKEIPLVNKEYGLSKWYEPQELTIPNVTFASGANTRMREMVPEAAKTLEQLFIAGKEDEHVLLSISGYRSYNYQKELYERNVNEKGEEYTSKYVAKAGNSEHQTGLAMVIGTEEERQLTQSFADTEAYKWIKEHAHDYGFIIRYPKGKEMITGYNFEPWHLRYMGKNVAKEIVEKEYTLEEYKSE